MTIGTDNQTVHLAFLQLLLWARKANIHQTVVYDGVSRLNNISTGAVVNHNYVTPKARKVSVILMNITENNTGVRQTVLSPNVFEAELHPCIYYTIMDREGNNVKIGFQSVLPQELEKGISFNKVEMEEKIIPMRRGDPSLSIWTSFRC